MTEVEALREGEDVLDHAEGCTCLLGLSGDVHGQADESTEGVT